MIHDFILLVGSLVLAAVSYHAIIRIYWVFRRGWWGRWAWRRR